MATGSKARDKVTIHTLRRMKSERRKIAMVTAYDATFARLLDQAGADILLVGDSLGMVIQGGKTTLPVTMEDMIYHTRAVVRGTQSAQVVGDMPFMSYQASLEEGIRNAGRLVREGGAEAVKLEGGAEYAELASRLVRAGIPVMGHIGLTPQSFHQLGGFKVQGRKDDDAKKLVDDAIALEQAGCYSIVLEGIPRVLGKTITDAVSIPTIGIGAGPDCDGQVLVSYDLLGLNEEFRPKFVKRYENLALRIRTAVEEYVAEVRGGQFPTDEHSFAVAPEKRAPAKAVGYGGGEGSSEPDDESVDASLAGCIPFPRKK